MYDTDYSKLNSSKKRRLLEEYVAHISFTDIVEDRGVDVNMKVFRVGVSEFMSREKMAFDNPSIYWPTNEDVFNYFVEELSKKLKKIEAASPTIFDAYFLGYKPSDESICIPCLGKVVKTLKDLSSINYEY